MTKNKQTKNNHLSTQGQQLSHFQSILLHVKGRSIFLKVIRIKLSVTTTESFDKRDIVIPGKRHGIFWAHTIVFKMCEEAQDEKYKLSHLLSTNSSLYMFSVLNLMLFFIFSSLSLICYFHSLQCFPITLFHRVAPGILTYDPERL